MYVLTYHSTYICPSLFGWKENILPKEHIVQWGKLPYQFILPALSNNKNFNNNNLTCYCQHYWTIWRRSLDPLDSLEGTEDPLMTAAWESFATIFIIWSYFLIILIQMNVLSLWVHSDPPSMEKLYHGSGVWRWFFLVFVVVVHIVVDVGVVSQWGAPTVDVCYIKVLLSYTPG